MVLERDNSITGPVAPRMTALERRESQLWWLAVIIMILLACALSSTDWISSVLGGRDDPLSRALNTRVMRFALIASVFAASAYFRDTARRLRRINSQLVYGLQRRTRELQRKNVELAKLKRLSESLITEMDLPKALSLAMDVAVEMIGADTASIMLREEDSDILRVVVSSGLPEEIAQNTRVRVGEALAGKVAESGEAILLNSDELDGELRNRTHRHREIVSSIIVPIRVGPEVRGVINVSKRRGGTCFSEDDLNTVSTLVNQTTMVIMKIEMWQDLQKQVAKLEAAMEELKRTQAELVQSEKLASIGQLAAGVAHEINNPLQVIMGRIELMMEDISQEGPLSSQLTTVMEHVDRISSIVSSLLQFSRRQPEDEQMEVSVDEAITGVIRLLGRQLEVDNIALDMDLGCAGVLMNASRVKMQQVFMNLILNAYDAMRGAGGALSIKTRALPECVSITFSDSGPGIPEDCLPHIFEPFFTTKGEGKGTGLGLFVTYEILKSFGGEIEVSSDVGRGVTFSITLPVSEVEKKAA